MALPYAEQPMSVSWNVCIQRLLSLKSGHNSARALGDAAVQLYSYEC